MSFLWSLLRTVLFAVALVAVALILFYADPNNANSAVATNLISALGLGITAAAGLYFLIDFTLFTIIRASVIKSILIPVICGGIIGAVCLFTAVSMG